LRYLRIDSVIVIELKVLKNNTICNIKYFLNKSVNKKNMKKTFWIHIDHNNYRTGTTIETYERPPNQENESDTSDDETPESAPQEATPFMLELPPFDNYRVYVCCDYPKYDVLFYVDCDTLKACKNFYLKIYSQINECLPFEVTGWTTGYKEEGYYPEVPEEIKALPEINLDKLEKDDMFDYFVIALGDNGNEYFTKLL
jgi:hypothetical protein